MLRKIIISIWLGLATYVGCKISSASSDTALCIMISLAATASSFGALYINELVDVIKKK